MLKVDVKIIAGSVTKKSMDLSPFHTYEDLLKELKINSETVVVLKDDVPQPIDCKVSGGKITILRVVSGG